jgi:hypothetical protein
MHAEINGLRGELKGEIAELRAEMQAGFARVRTDLQVLDKDVSAIARRVFPDEP